MSDNVPFEIQEEIIKRLPVKSLIRFRSVSKSWKSLIDSSDFITHYRSQRQHLLVYNYQSVDNRNCVSIVDDYTFPQHSVSVTLPLFVKMLRRYRKIGSSHGLLCLYREGEVVIWNPLITKAVVVNVPNNDEMFNTELGFGVCRETRDPKIVKIRYMDRFTDMEGVSSIPWQVEIFTVSTGEWRSLSSNLPRKSIVFGYRQIEDGVCVDGVYYWLATDRSTVDDATEAYTMIMSFDMTSEEFREVNLPDRFVYHVSMWDLDIYSLRESLVLVEFNFNNPVYDVWMMEDGVPKSFTKLFTFHVPDAIITCVHGFRKSGEVVMEVIEDDWEVRSLVVYEPNLKRITNLGISHSANDVSKIYVHSYMETLLLLDQPSFTIFDNGNRYVVNWNGELNSRWSLKHTSKV
ncbi:putative F-box domain-containing protein [Helianthus annuus]|uniref:F-box domain-containing protein n=1 Tax=Helianthus annuus TaxID=4232 RepID=A0A9K3DXJ8_HELAN|nr:putative F-box domain-containing protein [Helianthus annuus]